jgi:hypothetical protein
MEFRFTIETTKVVLGQAVTLQRLAIDEEAIITLTPTKPEASITQEPEQNREQRSTRDRKAFLAGSGARQPHCLQYEKTTEGARHQRSISAHLCIATEKFCENG